MDQKNSRRTKLTCYFTYLAMSSIFSWPPLLFATFWELYGISYTLLGTLVLVNFCTQLGIDLIFSFFNQYFNIHKTIRIMPLITAMGLCLYALIPMLFPGYAYIGLLAGTILFSVAAGLGEVLVSPTVAALPSDTPDKDMSILHSLYAYGFVSVVLLGTLFIHFVGQEYWMYLTFFWAIFPIIASVMLMRVQLPDMDMSHHEKKLAKSRYRTKSLALCVICIFLGSCAENTMTNWISVYIEKALHIPKVWGDILGMSLFGLLLGFTRTAYGKYGKNIFKVMLWSMVGSVVCYVTAALSVNALLSVVACVLVGVFTSMLWPGTLILMEEKIPGVGVAAYALMAAGGDFGASMAPQALGIIVDNISLTEWAKTFGQALSLTPEQVGFKVGVLIATLFPVLGLILLVYMKKHFKKHEM
ncbi:MAG: MFS transporter [Ruminococcaceae bacterium]|nr:MFS transporter [Oscillospiraceae bacterium]